MTYTARFWFVFLLDLAALLSLVAITVYTLGDIHAHRYPRRRK